MRLQAGGLTVTLPSRWEGAVSTSVGVDTDATVARRAATGVAPAVMPTTHLGNFALPPDRGDYGSGAVELMTADNAFVALVEFGRDEVGTPLFRTDGVPRRVRSEDFHPRALQRTIPGHCGLQVFASEAGRAFCLYVVLGSTTDRAPLIAEVNTVLSSLTIDPR